MRPLPLALAFAAAFAAAGPLAAAPSAGAGPAPPRAAAGVLFQDPDRDVEVRYDLRPDRVLFSAYLPAGWTFSVGVDGDQDGRWGYGAGMAAGTGKRSSGDVTYGQEADGGAFCAQYVFSSLEARPDDVYVSSDCNGYPSKGHVELGQIDSRERVTITYSIPAAELFGGRATAHLRACVWDKQVWSCQHSPRNPFLLPGPAPE